MALDKKSNEIYIVVSGEYADLAFHATCEEHAQAVQIRDEYNAEPGLSRDLVARIETIRHYRKGQKVS